MNILYNKRENAAETRAIYRFDMSLSLAILYQIGDMEIKYWKIVFQYYIYPVTHILHNILIYDMFKKCISNFSLLDGINHQLLRDQYTERYKKKIVFVLLFFYFISYKHFRYIYNYTY